jgi:hypothetical protein
MIIDDLENDVEIDFPVPRSNASSRSPTTLTLMLNVSVRLSLSSNKARGVATPSAERRFTGVCVLPDDLDRLTSLDRTITAAKNRSEL